MKKTLAALVLSCAILASARPLDAAPSPSLRVGVYALEGYNPGADDRPYIGTVTIRRTGASYELVWHIGTVQTQKGVGLLEGNVLSVGYADLSGRDFGVVSYRIVRDGHLEGRWSPLGSSRYGREILRMRKTP